MTICIASLFDNGNGCILASDQMITANIPMGYEFENPEIEKIRKITENIFILTAGDVLFANEVISRAIKKVYSDDIKDPSHFAEILRVEYHCLRMQRIVQTEIETRGLDLQSYYNHHQRLNPGVVQMIDQTMKQFNPGVDFIVAGKSAESCHIYSINNPAITTCHDAIGFVAVGSGSPHAIYSLIGSEYKKSMNKEKVGKLVKKAKENSEVAPGVGKETSIVFIGLEDNNDKQ